MKMWKPIKGKCLLCERARKKGHPVLRYKYVKTTDRHVLQCTICKTEWEGNTKADVMRQVGE